MIPSELQELVMDREAWRAGPALPVLPHENPTLAPPLEKTPLPATASQGKSPVPP